MPTDQPDTAASWCGYHGRVDDCTKTGCSFCDGLLSHDPDRCSCCGRGHKPEPDTAACRHCGEPITHGTVWAHVVGPGSRLIRCDPAKSGKPYGLNAEPVEANDAD